MKCRFKKELARISEIQVTLFPKLCQFFFKVRNNLSFLLLSLSEGYLYLTKYLKDEQMQEKIFYFF